VRMAPELAVEVEHLNKTYAAGVLALNDVSFAAPAGAVLGVLGPNGAGKTTAIRILTTLLKPDSGSVRIAGLDLSKDPEGIRRRIGLSGQSATIDEGLTGTENLLLIGWLNHMRRADRKSRAAELLVQFGLSDDGGRILKTYSGGMRRRLDLAVALMARPSVLFLDEPTTGLDPRSRGDLWITLEHLVSGGTTLILTTQYLEEADRLADHICVVDQGQVVAEGTPTQLKARIGGPTIEVVLTSMESGQMVEDMLRGLGSGSPIRNGAVVSIESTTGLETMTEVTQRLELAGVEVATLQLRRPSLDEVFMALTGTDSQSLHDSSSSKGVEITERLPTE